MNATVASRRRTRNIWLAKIAGRRSSGWRGGCHPTLSPPSPYASFLFNLVAYTEPPVSVYPAAMACSLACLILTCCRARWVPYHGALSFEIEVDVTSAGEGEEVTSGSVVAHPLFVQSIVRRAPLPLHRLLDCLCGIGRRVPAHGFIASLASPAGRKDFFPDVDSGPMKLHARAACPHAHATTNRTQSGLRHREPRHTHHAPRRSQASAVDHHHR